MKRKILTALSVCVVLFFGMGAINNYIMNRMTLFVDNPLALSHADSDVGITIHKFGRNAEPTAADDVWDCSEAAIGAPAVYPHQTAAFSLYASSDSAGDTTQTVVVEGLDASWERVSETVALDGQNYELVGTATNWLRVFRAYNSSGTVFAGNIYLGLDAAGAGGVPTNVATTLQACIQIGIEQTLMAIYTAADDEETWIAQECASALDTSPGTPGYATMNISTRRNLPAVQTFRVSQVFGLGADGTSDRCTPFNPPVYVPKRTDIKAVIEGVSLNEVTSTFHVIAIKE